jgi:hypothetical protein
MPMDDKMSFSKMELVFKNSVSSFDFNDDFGGLGVENGY